MESLPALHPIVLKSISSPPFTYIAEKGLTFRGHPRESIADLRSWLFPGRKNAGQLDKTKDWWMAQSILHGIRAKDSMRKGVVMDIVKSAVSAGLEGPPEDILQLEKELERKLLLENAEARDKEYLILDEEDRIAKYSERYLREKFFDGTSNKENMIVFHVRDGRSGGEVQAAAKKLGLHIEDTSASRGRQLLIVGKDEVGIHEQAMMWWKGFYKWNEERKAAKRWERRQFEKANKLWRREYEATGVGSFKDCEGEWLIECPAIYDSSCQQYRRSNHQGMSIFFQDPDPEEEEDDFSSEDDNSCYESDDDSCKDDGGDTDFEGESQK